MYFSDEKEDVSEELQPGPKTEEALVAVAKEGAVQWGKHFLGGRVSLPKRESNVSCVFLGFSEGGI